MPKEQRRTIKYRNNMKPTSILTTTTNTKKENDMKQLQQRDETHVEPSTYYSWVPLEDDDRLGITVPAHGPESYEWENETGWSDESLYVHEFDSDMVFDNHEGFISVQLLAEKVVATAWMRRSQGFPPTNLRINEVFGVCEGTKMHVATSSAILVSMAGCAWESREDNLPIEDIFKFDPQEVEKARQLITELQLSKIGNNKLNPEVIEALVLKDMSMSFLVAEAELNRASEFIGRVGSLLARKGSLSAGKFDFWCRDYDRRQFRSSIDALVRALQQPAA